MILFHNKDFHLYGFKPRHSHGSWSAYGIAIKKRVNIKEDIWYCFHLRLHKKAKPIPYGKRCYIYETESWYQRGAKIKDEGYGVIKSGRIRTKRFIRLRIGLGDTRPKPH